eukprot:UC4_evm1s1264
MAVKAIFKVNKRLLKKGISEEEQREDWIEEEPLGKRRPDVSQISEEAPKELVDIMTDCWLDDPAQRPLFPDILRRLQRHLESATSAFGRQGSDPRDERFMDEILQMKKMMQDLKGGQDEILDNQKKLYSGIRSLHHHITKGFQEARKLILEVENVSCPYIFTLEKKEEAGSSQDKGGVFSKALKKVKRIASAASIREKLRASISEDYELSLLCGVSLKKVVSYRLTTRIVSKRADQIVNRLNALAKFGVGAIACWNMAAKASKIFGVPLPNIPPDQLEEYQEFLESLSTEGFLEAQKAANSSTMGLDTLRAFEEFLNSVMSDEANAGEPRWNEVLFRVVNDDGQLTFACAEEAEGLEKK